MKRREAEVKTAVDRNGMDSDTAEEDLWLRGPSLIKRERKKTELSRERKRHKNRTPPRLHSQKTGVSMSITTSGNNDTNTTTITIFKRFI